MEPNDTLGTASILPIDGGINAVLDTNSDLDWFRVTFQHPGRFKVSILNPPPSIQSQLQLYGRHAQWLGVFAGALNVGDDLHLTYDVAEPGTYFIRVRNLNVTDSLAPYDITTTFTVLDDVLEPNNASGQSSLISSATLQARIFPQGDEDWYRLYAEAGEVLSYTLDSSPLMKGELTLYSPEMEWQSVHATAVNPGDRVLLNHTVASTGFYYLRLRDLLSQAHTQEYVLSVQGGSPGFSPTETPSELEVEPNDLFSEVSPVPFPGRITGSIAHTGDVDWLGFDVIEPGQAVFSMGTTAEDIQLVAQLLNDSKQSLIQARADLPGASFGLQYHFTLPGRYYLRMSNSLRLEVDDVDYTFESTFIPVRDIFEPNQDYGDATPLGVVNQVQGFLFGVGDQDWFRVEVGAPDDLRVILSQLPSNITPALNLFDLSGQNLKGQVGHAGVDLELEHGISVPGTYLIRVADQGNNDASTQPYTLTVFGAEFESYAPVAVIESIIPGAIIVGDTLMFRGFGEDSDGIVEGYEWRSSLDGPLSEQAVFESNSLSIGTHDIFLRVRDNQGFWSTEVRQSVYVGSTISDEMEPNDSFSSANEIGLGRTLTGKIDRINDHDVYRLYVPGPGRLDALLANIPVNLRMEIVFYNQYWDWLGVYRSAVAPGDDVQLGMDVAQEGWVFLRVRDLENSENTEFTYTLSTVFVETADVFEPNNSVLESAQIQSATVSGYFFPSGDDDWYQVWIEAGSNLHVELETMPSDIRGEISLLGVDRQWLGVFVNAVNPGDPVAIKYDVNESGFYFLRVRALDSLRNFTEPYRLVVTGAEPGFVPDLVPVRAEVEPNNRVSIANLIALGGEVVGAIQESRDEDWFRLEMETPGLLRVQVSEWAANLRGRIDFYRYDLQHLGLRQATNPGDTLTTEWRISNPGTYYIKLNASGTVETSDQPYRLALEWVPVVDVYEPNNRFHDAVPLSGQNRVNGYLFDDGDVDFYQVQSQIGNTLRISVGEVPVEIQTQLDIYDKDQRVIASKRASNNGQPITLEMPVTETGLYGIRFSDIGNNSFSTSPYTLVIDGADFSSYVPLAMIESISPNPAATGEPVQLTGRGEDADGTIVGYQWRSSIDGVFSISQSPLIEDLTPGVHTIYFQVRDNDQNRSPEVATTLFLGVPAPQEQEPNDVGGSATQMLPDQQYSGKMDGVGDEDWFRISVSQPGRLTVRGVNPPGSAIRLGLETYTPDLDWMGVTANATNDGDEVVLDWDLPGAGHYYLRIRDLSNRADGEYTVSASFEPATDPFEPNSNQSESALIGNQETIEATIFPQQDEDWYRLPIDTPGTIHISLSPVPGDLRLEASFYGQNLEWLGAYSSASNPGDNLFIEYDAPTAGTYYVRIRDVNNAVNPSETYRLSVQFDSVMDLFEPNDDYASATLVDRGVLEAYVFPSGDEDFYKIYVDPPGTMTVNVDQVPDNLRLEASLYDANFTWLGIHQASDTEGGRVGLNVENASGLYYLRLRDLDGDRSAVEHYRLSVIGARLEGFPVQTPVISEMEPNNDFARANSLGLDSCEGLFSGDDDYYIFDVDHPSQLAVVLQVPGTIRSRISLFNANHQHLDSREAENPGDSSTLNYDLGSAGRYYVRLSALDGGASDLPYTVSLHTDPAVDGHEPNPNYAMASSISLNETYSALLFPNGDRDWYRVDIPEPGMLSVRIEAVPLNIQAGLRVYNQDLQRLTTKQVLNSGDPVFLDLPIEKRGPYWIEVYDQGDNHASTSPYTLKVNLVANVDVHEPNDRFQDATVMGDANQVRGLIFPAGDWDWYRFDMPQSGTIRIQVTETAGFLPDVRIYDDSKKLLKRVYPRNSETPVDFAYEISSPDTYYVTISDLNGQNVGESAYVLTLEGVPFQNQHPLADRILSFSENPVLVGEPVEFTGEGTDADGVVLDYEWTSNLDGHLGNGQVISLNTLSEGVHTIRMRVQDDQGLWSGKVEQSLIVTPGFLLESEYNNEADQAFSIPLDEWVVGAVSPQGDMDYFRIYVGQCGVLNILMDAVPPAMKAEVVVYDAEGGWIGNQTTAILDGEWMDLRFFVNPGYYLIRVRDIHANGYRATYALKAWLEHGGDRFEPNETFSEAQRVDLNGVVSGLDFCSDGDEDYFQLNPPTSGRLGVELVNVDPAMRGEISFYDKNFSWIGVYRGALNPGEYVRLEYDVVDVAPYYIRIRDMVSSVRVRPYDLKLDFVPVEDPYEPNDGHGTASLLTDSVTEAMIFRGGDEDWYRVYAEEGVNLAFSLTELPADMRGEMTLYNSNREWLSVHQTANNQGDEVFVNYLTSTSGMLFIRIRDVDNQSHVAPYRLTVTGDVEFGFEPEFAPVTLEVEGNGQWDSANDIALETDITGHINPVRDIDRFRFWVNVAGILQVEHTDVAAEVTSEIRVYNSSLAQVAHRTTTNPGESNLLEVPIVEAGYYFLHVNDRGNDHHSEEPYRLHLIHTPVVDDFEPNDVIGMATPLDQSAVNAFLFPGSDQDFYRVYLNGPGSLTLSLDEVPEVIRPRLRVYDANGVQRETWVNTNPGVGGESVLVYEAPQSGYYYVRVSDEDGNYSGEPYVLRIEGADFSLAPRLAGIGDREIEATLTYTINLAAEDPDNPQDLVFSASNLPPGASFNPDTRMFTWTPGRGQVGSYPGVHFEVNDGTFTASEDITIMVRTHNRAPVLGWIGERILEAEKEFRMVLTAEDPDEGDTLVFSAEELPSGAEFNAETATLIWIPTLEQVGIYRDVLFSVSDGERTDFEYIRMEVILPIEDPYQAWLQFHFSEEELLNPEWSGEESDPDMDTMSNWEEYMADTHPLDASSVLKITRIIRQEQGMEIHVTSGVKAIVILEKRAGLTGSHEGWQVIHTLQPPTEINPVFLDDLMETDTAFYRIRAWQP